MINSARFIVAAFATACIISAAPALAMPTVSDLQFPDKDSGWGCAFYGSCLLSTEKAQTGN